MIPIVTPEEMAGVDAGAPEPVEVLVERAGYAVAAAASQMVGSTYGRRVIVVAGRGNNGADGRAAARVLARRGAAVRVVDAGAGGGRGSGGGRGDPVDPVDLVIDAAYGTGLNRGYSPPDFGAVPVLAVDIPSGLSGLTGLPVEGGGAVRAERTVTFQAFKPGLLLGEGPDRAGRVVVADIGLGQLVDTATRAWVVTDADVAGRLPARARQSHKWVTAVAIVGGSPGMYGAPMMVARGAMRAGAGYALVAVPGAPPGGGLPPGAYVGHSLPARDWDKAAAELAGRARALVVGPGLGSGPASGDGDGGPGGSVARLLGELADIPAVVDADGLTALGGIESVRRVAAGRAASTVLTPHEGEFARMVGRAPLADRITDVREVARQTEAVVLLKGSPTVVADPDGRLLVVTSGSARLATAGTGDVLSGVIGALMARGLPGLEAAALGAHCHGRAASLGPEEGLVASDLPDLVSRWLSGIRP